VDGVDRAEPLKIAALEDRPSALKIACGLKSAPMVLWAIGYRRGVKKTKKYTFFITLTFFVSLV
jgi:hypothetical protein